MKMSEFCHKKIIHFINDSVASSGKLIEQIK